MINEIINGTGLIIDIIGVFLIFKWSALNYKSIGNRFLSTGWGSQVDVNTNNLGRIIEEINKMIEGVNRRNEINKKKSVYALGILAMGFLLQFIAVLF